MVHLLSCLIFPRQNKYRALQHPSSTLEPPLRPHWHMAIFALIKNMGYENQSKAITLNEMLF